MKEFADGSHIAFGRGEFDDWCVYLTRPSTGRTPPRNTEYFSVIQRLAIKHGDELVWRDLERIFAKASVRVDHAFLEEITDLSSKYGADQMDFDIAATSIYLGMIAEENKKNTRLGKRIKQLGLHQVVRERMPVHDAAHFSRGMRWHQIDRECAMRGF